jgi:Ni/Co efflux regulator RcnB
MNPTLHTRAIIAVIAVAVVAAAGATSAQDSSAAARQWWQKPEVQQKLNLTEAQVAEITNLDQELGARAEAATEARSDAWQAVKTAAAEQPSGEAFVEAAEAYRNAVDGLAVLSIERIQALTTILSSEQFAALSGVAPAALAPKVGASAGGGGGLRSVGGARTRK